MTDKELYLEYMKSLSSLKDDRFSMMSKEMLNGKNSYLKLKFTGSSIFNPEWIKKIEDCLYELGQIVNNPREVTDQVGAVMPIELAKKINYESVQHLASHSQYIKEITETGDVVPAKILGIYNKEEIHTYENRFIATFIRRLVLFIEKRYEFIKKTVNLNEKEIMYVKNKSIIDGQEVEVETKITVTREKEDDLSKKARDYIARIEEIKDYITYYYNSPFMKEFKTEKDVRRPIILTNILRKNPLYHKCYETFLFIEKFDSLGIAFKVDRDYQTFNEKERKELSEILLSNLLFLQNHEKRPYKKTEKVYKPKLLTSIDDESFLYGDLVKGPIEFVRADEHYRNRLNELVPKDLPLHPNRMEKEYYKDEYAEKKALHAEVKEIEALLARIRRQIAKYEKLVDKLLEERKVEEAEEAKRKLEELKQKEQDLLNKKRQEIIDAAKQEENTAPKKSKKAKKEPEPEPVVEETPVEEEKPQEEPEPAPVEEEQPQEEVPAEEPVEEQPTEEPAEEPVPGESNIEEEPQEEEAPIEEPQEEPKEEEQPSEEVLPVEEDGEPEPEPEPIIEEAQSEEQQPEEEPQPVEEPIEETPVAEEPSKEEEPAQEEEKPVEKPKKKKKKAAKKKKAVKEEKPVEQEPIKEEPTPEPEPEPQPEPQPEPEPEPVPAPIEEELKKEEKKKPSKKAKPKAKAKPAPKKVEKKEPAKKEKKAPVKKPAPKKEKEKPEVIPGKFIVKTLEGYYVNQKRMSDYKDDAKIFNDFNEANAIKKKLGGKVVKLWAKKKKS